MFWHNFKAQFKITLHDRGLIFWTLAFPLIMATLFNLAFSNIENSESLQVIPLAIVDDTGWQDATAFREAFTELSRPDSADQLFDTTYVANLDEAEQLLRTEAVAGVLVVEQKQPKVIARKSDINITILKSVVDQISAQSTIAQTVATQNPTLLSRLAQAERANLQNSSREHLSYTMIEYYSLIAMTCLYGGMLSMAVINRLLANMSASGRRIAVSPAPKGLLLASGLLVSYLIQLFGLLLLFSYTVFILHVDYGDQTPLTILLALIGSCAGLALGALIASAFRVGENTKVGLMITITMFSCFLAGMMGITMKYLVDTNLPLLNQLNPANLITDGLYSLYYYTTFDRFWSDIITLVIITLVIISVSVFCLRKEQYDNL